MNNDRLIFVTNDDSYASKGFAAVIEVARRFGKVIAVAPEHVQSGMSQAITIHNPLFLRKVSESDDVTIYALNGTPVDCVKFAFDHMLADRKIDLTISGINHGSNAAVNVLYSGTMGAAIESAFYGVPSVGLSNVDHSDDADFEACIEYGIRIAKSVIDSDIRPLCLNVNVPILPANQIKGVMGCRQTKGFWVDEVLERTDPYGKSYYWFTGGFQNAEPEAVDTDEWALKSGYVSVVPVQVDLTSYQQMKALADILE